MNEEEDLRLEVINQALRAAVYGASLEQIAYTSRMSTGALGRYFSFMAECGLMKYDGESDIFTTTEAGKSFLKRHTGL